MKKSVILISALAASMIPFRAFAAEESVRVHVTISQEQIVLDQDITVTDVDGDGRLTSEDAILTAHNSYYPGGAAAGYAGEEFIWGMQGGYIYENISKGETEDPEFFCAVEDRRELKNGDSLSWWADAVCDETYYIKSDYLYEKLFADAIPQGTEIDVKVMHMIPTQPNDVPAANVELLMDGKKTGVITDKDGNAKLRLDTVGEHILSVDSEKLGGEYYCDLYFSVIPADEQVQTHVVIRTSNNKDERACFDHTIAVTDWDKDGRLTTDDALWQIHEKYFPGGDSIGLGQDMIWGRSGMFVCEMTNAAGKNVFSGAAANKRAIAYDLEPGCTVTFRPENKLWESYQLTWGDGISVSTLNSPEPGFRTTVFAVHWLPDSSVPQAIANTELLIDGRPSGIFTDEEGYAIVPMNESGTHTITAAGFSADALNTLTFEVGEPEIIADAESETDAPASTEITAAPETDETAVESSRVTKQPANAPAVQSQAAAWKDISGSAKNGADSSELPMLFASLAISGGLFAVFTAIRRKI